MTGGDTKEKKARRRRAAKADAPKAPKAEKGKGKGRKEEGKSKRKSKSKTPRKAGKAGGGSASKPRAWRACNALDTPGSIMDVLDDFALMRIFSHLDAPSLSCVARVCKHFALLTREDAVWEGVLEHTTRLMGAAPAPPENTSPLPPREAVRRIYVGVRSSYLSGALTSPATLPVHVLGWLRWSAVCSGTSLQHKRVRNAPLDVRTTRPGNTCIVHVGIPSSGGRPLGRLEELTLRGTYEDITWSRDVFSPVSAALLREHRGVQLRSSVVNDGVHTLLVTRGEDMVECVLMLQSLRRMPRHAWWKSSGFHVTVTMHTGARVLCTVADSVRPGSNPRLDIVSADTWGKKPRVRGALALPWQGMAFGGELPLVLLVSVQVRLGKTENVVVSLDGPMLFTPRAGAEDTEWDGTMHDGRVGEVGCHVITDQHKGKDALFVHSLYVAV